MSLMSLFFSSASLDKLLRINGRVHCSGWRQPNCGAWCHEKQEKQEKEETGKHIQVAYTRINYSSCSFISIYFRCTFNLTEIPGETNYPKV